MNCLPNLPLTAFRSLCSISVTSAEYTLNLIEHTLSAQRCIAPMPYLHTVQLPYTVPSDIPITLLPNLTCLELVSMHSYAGLGALLRRVPQLRALALFSPVHNQEQIFAELAAAKADVPRLAALALQGPSPLVTILSPTELAQSFAQFCAFLHGRTALRRLYLTFEIATAGLPAYLKTIATLKNMEIFDLRMEDQPFDRAFLADLTRCLPATLNAMKLTTAGLLSDKDAFADFVRVLLPLLATADRCSGSGRTSPTSAFSTCAHGRTRPYLPTTSFAARRGWGSSGITGFSTTYSTSPTARLLQRRHGHRVRQRCAAWTTSSARAGIG